MSQGSDDDPSLVHKNAQLQTFVADLAAAFYPI